MTQRTEPSKDKKLIVNSDDFGLTPSVNRGIVKCFEDGIVTSASILSVGKAFEDAVQLSKDYNLNVGIHLSLTQGKPLSPLDRVTSLTGKNGLFLQNYVRFASRFFRSRISLTEVKTEFQAQIRAFLSSGLDPNHINGHQHVHLFPGVIDVVIGLMKEYGIRSIRVPCANLNDAFRPPSPNSLAKLFLLYYSRSALHKIRENGLYSADFFEGLFTSGRLTKKNLMRILDRIQPGVTELVCHPGFQEAEPAARHAWNYRWEEEIEALCDLDVKKKIEQEQIVLSLYPSLSKH